MTQIPHGGLGPDEHRRPYKDQHVILEEERSCRDYRYGFLGFDFLSSELETQTKK
jgi:hypothetical protein